MQNKGKLSRLIDKALRQYKEPTRNYIGASIIGSNCWRKIWYELTGAKKNKVEPKLLRTFHIGKALENLVTDYLELANIDIYWPSSGQFVDRDHEFIRGSVDALLKDKNGKITHVLEIKTANDANYNKFFKHGLLLWNKTYYAQVQMYMRLTDIHKAYVLVLNKDSSEIQDEEIFYDEDFANSLIEKARIIYNCESAPDKISNNPTWFQCKNCQYNKVCHK